MARPDIERPVRRAARRRAHPTQILLFDLDGVLVQSGGYHASLREVVRLAGRALGFPKAELPASAIALFEAFRKKEDVKQAVSPLSGTRVPAALPFSCAAPGR